MTLRRQYFLLTCNLTVWEPHHALLYDYVFEARKRIRDIKARIWAGSKWEDEA